MTKYKRGEICSTVGAIWNSCYFKHTDHFGDIGIAWKVKQRRNRLWRCELNSAVPCVIAVFRAAGSCCGLLDYVQLARIIQWRCGLWYSVIGQDHTANTRVMIPYNMVGPHSGLVGYDIMYYGTFILCRLLVTATHILLGSHSGLLGYDAVWYCELSSWPIGLWHRVTW
jgi:hypothetical protein